MSGERLLFNELRKAPFDKLRANGLLQRFLTHRCYAVLIETANWFSENSLLKV
jgi:hypothetical protein